MYSWMRNIATKNPYTNTCIAISARLRLRSYSTEVDTFLPQTGRGDLTEPVGDSSVGAQRRQDARLGGLGFGCTGGDQPGRGDQHPGGRRLEVKRFVGGPDRGRAVDQAPCRRRLETGLGDDDPGLPVRGPAGDRPRAAPSP